MYFLLLLVQVGLARLQLWKYIWDFWWKVEASSQVSVKYNRGPYRIRYVMHSRYYLWRIMKVNHELGTNTGVYGVVPIALF